MASFAFILICISRRLPNICELGLFKVCLLAACGPPSSMRGAGRREHLSSCFFPGAFWPFVFLFPPLSLNVMWWVHSMDRTLMPDGIASTLVDVYPFLFTTFLAVDGSETCFAL